MLEDNFLGNGTGKYLLEKQCTSPEMISSFTAATTRCKQSCKMAATTVLAHFLLERPIVLLLFTIAGLRMPAILLCGAILWTSIELFLLSRVSETITLTGMEIHALEKVA